MISELMLPVLLINIFLEQNKTQQSELTFLFYHKIKAYWFKINLRATKTPKKAVWPNAQITLQ